MAKVQVETKLAVPASMVWNTIGNFHALADWHPAVEKSEETSEAGKTLRRLTLSGGGVIVDRLETLDDKERSYSYTIQEGPLPVANYSATLTVRDLGPSSCEVAWSSEFDPEGVPESDAAKAVREIYEAGFENLRKMFPGPAA